MEEGTLVNQKRKILKSLGLRFSNHLVLHNCKKKTNIVENLFEYRMIRMTCGIFFFAKITY